MMIDNIRVIIEQGPFSAEDAQYYIERIKATTKFTLKKITFTRSDTYLDIRYAFAEIPFERILFSLESKFFLFFSPGLLSRMLEGLR